VEAIQRGPRANATDLVRRLSGIMKYEVAASVETSMIARAVSLRARFFVVLNVFHQGE